MEKTQAKSLTMKHVLLAILTGMTFHLASAAEHHQFSLPPVDMLKSAKEKSIYRLSSPTQIDGPLVSKVNLEGSSCVVTYTNKSDPGAVRPNYTFRIYNGYGIEIGRMHDKWVFDEIKHGETRVSQLSFAPHPHFLGLLDYTVLVQPEDWRKPVYLIVEGPVP
jgi:hypothetical protein